ncbi:MAG: radical SAM protein [Candidatus Sericytochromatia bacterium]
MMYLRGKDFDQSKVIAPLAFGYLAAYLREHLNFTDLVLVVDDPDKLLAQNPQVIGISSFTETFEDVIKHARYFKRVAPEIPIILGGEHISALPESLPEAVDVGILGEGEETLTELMALYLRKEASADNLAKIPGLVFWHEGKRVQSPSRAWISNLDDIPPPDRFLLHNTNPHWQQAIFTARGCPYKCTFCASTRFWQKTRYHSVDRVIQEMEYILKHFPNQPLIAINDDLFPLNKKRLKTMVEAIREKGIHRKVGFVLNARASVFDEEIARLLQAMNGQVVGFGFESASDKVLTAIKGKTSAKENLKALELCEKYGLAVVGNFMSGGPDENEEDMAKTWWFIQKNRDRIWHPSVGLATPFPGTEFWEKAEAMKLIGPDFDRWNALDLGFRSGESIYMNPVVSEAEFEPIYEEFRQFQARPDISKDHFSQIRVKQRYLEQVFGKIAEQYPQASQILELGPDSSHLAPILSQAQVTHLAPQAAQLDLSSVAGQKFDLVVLAHCLEKLKDPLTELKKLIPLLAENAELVCLNFHAGHLSVLVDLLKGRWEPQIFAVNHHRALRFFNAQNLQDLFQSAGLETAQMELFKFPDPKLQEAAQQLAPILAPFIPLETYHKNQDCFSLILTARQPQPVASFTPARLTTELALPGARGQ